MEVMQRFVHLKYNLEDTATAFYYTGCVELGSVNPYITIENDIIVQHVKSWMRSTTFDALRTFHFIQYWGVPSNQQIVNFNFSTTSTCIDVPENLNIPLSHLTPGRCFIGNIDIILIERPQHLTWLGWRTRPIELLYPQNKLVIVKKQSQNDSITRGVLTF